MTFKELITEIAVKIRAKDGTTGKISPWDYPARIEAIPTGGGGGQEEEIIDRSITQYSNGEIAWIGKHAFRECKDLLSVNFPKVSIVRQYAFSECNNLEIVSMPAAGTIEGYAFENCTALKQIELPVCRILAKYSFKGAGIVTAKVKGGSIGSYAFQDCASLEKVDVSGSVWTINPYAFSGCSKLTALILRDWTGSWNVPKENAFTGTPILEGGGYIYVPRSMMSYLQAEADWAPLWWDVTRAIEDWPDITGG